MEEKNGGDRGMTEGKGQKDHMNFCIETNLKPIKNILNDFKLT